MRTVLREMRGLATRSVRPRLQNSRPSFSIPPIRRTTFPPLQRALTCGDAFLILLPSVLTAAFVVDFTGKERRRAEWDRQIAIAEEEAEQLKQRQLEAWSRIQCRSVSHGAWQQRRTLFTASRSSLFIDEEREREMDPWHRQDEINEADADAPPLADQTTEEYQDIQQRFGRLLATKTALQMMLQLRIGRSALNRPNVPVDTTATTYKQSIDYIVHELDKVTNLITTLRIHHIPWDIQMPEEYYERQEEMHRHMADLSEKYRLTEMNLPDYVMGFVQLVNEYKIGPPLKSYVDMMRALAWHQFESPMAQYVENTICDSHEYLDSYTISNILYRHGKAIDSVSLNHFLDRLTRADQHPRPRSLWYRAHVNDMDIAIPKSKHGHLLTGLIRAALTNRQQTVAEAYATVFIDRDRIDRYSGIHKWFVVGNFLFGYGTWGSWNAGRRWLQTAVTWSSDFVEASTWALGRVILRMLDFCVSCGKKDEYEMIMSAALAANIPVPPIDPHRPLKLTDRVGQIRLDWIERTRQAGLDEQDQYAPITQAQVKTFQSKLNGRFDTDQNLEKKPFHPSDSEWSEAASVGWNPILAAKRLEQVSAHRQQTVNTGFKNFPPGPIEYPIPRPGPTSDNTPTNFEKPLELPKSHAFPPQGPQNSLTQEPLDVEFISNPALPDFTSPFFNHAHDEGPASNQTQKPSASSVPQSSQIDDLKRALATANRRIQKLEQRKLKEVTQMKRDLEAAQARVRELEMSMKPDGGEDWIKASAAG